MLSYLILGTILVSLYGFYAMVKHGKECFKDWNAVPAVQRVGTALKSHKSERGTVGRAIFSTFWLIFDLVISIGAAIAGASLMGVRVGAPVGAMIGICATIQIRKMRGSKGKNEKRKEEL